ncbi:hypothetical protein BJX64DRAFT_212770 [Aspergillus heterothallicus]
MIGTSALSQICTPPDLYAYTIINQNDADLIAENCTTVEGNIRMSTNYTGSLYLPNVKNITGAFTWQTLLGYDDTPSPTSVDMPDLEYIGQDLAMDRLKTLRSFSAPRLKSVHWSVHVGYAVDVDLRALESVEYFYYSGNASTLRLDSLREVRESASICNKDSCARKATPGPAFDLSLPSLEAVSELTIDGRFSSLSLPQLRNVSRTYAASGGLKIGTSAGDVLNITLPKLEHVSDGISVHGAIGSFAMDSMRNISGFHLETSVALNMSLPIEEAGAILVVGNMTEVRFPNLRSWTYLEVLAQVDFDCGITAASLPNSTAHSWLCRAPEKEPDSSLSTSAKIGIGIGAGVGGLVIIVFVAWLFWKRKRRGERLKSESNMHLHEVPPSYSEVRMQDNPPEYGSARSAN